MNRRTLLLSALPIGLGLFVQPDGSLSPARTTPADGPDLSTRVGWVVQALETSRLWGKPLLVLTTPAVGRRDWDRSFLFGGWLSHGSDATLARIAEVEVVAASSDELTLALGRPPWRRLTGYPLFWLVESDIVTRLDAPLTRVEGRPGESDLEHGERQIDATHATLDRLLTHAIGDQSERNRRAAAVRAALSPRDVDQLVAFLSEAGSAVTPDTSLVDRGAAILAAGVAGASPRRVIGALAEAARARVVKKRIPGTLWCNFRGCGPDHCEGDDLPPPTYMVACGMGFVPERSRRFLRHYVAGA